MVSGGTASETPAPETGELVTVAVGVPVAPAMPVAAVVAPVWFADDELLLDEEDDDVA